MATRAAGDGVMNLFLTLAVATSLVIGSLGYATGSTPEWVMVKSSIGLAAVGVIGWIVSAMVRSGAEKQTVEGKGNNVDVTVSEGGEMSSDQVGEPENSRSEVIGA